GPMNRGVEIAQAVANGPRAVILEQVTNGVAVRMAVLYLLSESRRRAETGAPAGQASPRPAPAAGRASDTLIAQADA
ncbi:hypothetical protein FJ251_08280, partial [bacterium]|nr:hypothetical protein [bacterium]